LAELNDGVREFIIELWDAVYIARPYCVVIGGVRWVLDVGEE
jgi:hypothetical protein